MEQSLNCIKKISTAPLSPKFIDSILNCLVNRISCSIQLKAFASLAICLLKNSFIIFQIQQLIHIVQQVQLQGKQYLFQMHLKYLFLICDISAELRNIVFQEIQIFLKISFCARNQNLNGI
jgi:hypothetical protein